MSGSAQIFEIFWLPTNNESRSYTSLIQTYSLAIGDTSLYHNNIQYTDVTGHSPLNTVFSNSVFVDTRPYPESPLLDSDIRNEIANIQSFKGWFSNLDNIFFVFLERNQNLCFDSTHAQCASSTFCAYHSFFQNDTIYAAIPYAASFNCRAPGQTEPNSDDVDLTLNVTSHEQMEAATDPLLNAWFDANQQEVGDKCNFTFGPLDGNGGDINLGPTFSNTELMLQQEWDNTHARCTLGP